MSSLMDLIPPQDRQLLPETVNILLDLGSYLGIKHGASYIVPRGITHEGYLNGLFAELIRGWMMEAERIYGKDRGGAFVEELLKRAWESVAAMRCQDTPRRLIGD